jgi:hypothetical protein
MDWTTLGLSTFAVFGLMFAAGFCISLLSSLMQCGKTGMGTSAMQGALWAVGPSLIYVLATTVQIVRDPFKIYNSSIYAVGFLMMMIVWPMTVYNINNTERAVCVPSTSEMTAFKTKLLAELKQKQEAEEKNKNASVLKK